MAQMLGVRLDDDLHKEFKILCVRRGQNMSAVLRALIVRWIAEQKGEVLDGKEARDGD